MARDVAIEARLQRWAEAVKVGDGSGYARVNTLHPNWSPPSKGVRATMKVAASSDVAQTHRALGRLSVRLRNTVVVHYVMGGSLAEQAVRLDCAESTVVQRVELAHRHLLKLLEEDDAGLHPTSIQLAATN